MKKLLILVALVFSVSKLSFAEEKHDDHAHDEKEHKESDEHGEEGHDDHGEEEHGDEHEGEEENSAVGPDKGILEKSENGFKLSPEAIKSFELKTQKFVNNQAQFPRPTLVEVKEEKFVYRMRDGWIKKIPVKVLKKDKVLVTLELSQFKNGDEIIVSGTGFVRVSELVAEEGMAEGHAH